MKKNKLLIVLDGWGHSNNRKDNAILMAKTPSWDSLIANYPNTLIGTSGNSVGLPEGQMGNSEVGHLTIGAGRIIEQDFTRIQKDIDSGGFIDNPALTNALNSANQENGAVHIIGLLSDGGVHSHQKHLHAMLDMTKQKGCKEVYFHLIADGRDTPPQSLATFVFELEEKIKELNTGRIASIVGRFYAMDRDNRWERIEKAYNLLTTGKSEYTAARADTAIQNAYDRGESDEFIAPAVLSGYTGMADGDAILMANFRADRVRQLLGAFLDPAFEGFARPRRHSFAAALGMSEYSSALNKLMTCMFPHTALKNVLGETVSAAGLKQLRLAETEKYAHVTFFLNGGEERVFAGEERVLVPSPKVATYDLQPEMSAAEVTDKLVAAIASVKYDLIVVNYANSDMVGHTGKLEAAVLAVQMIDRCLGRLCAALDAVGGCMLITADHGNIEMMRDPESDGAHTAHTTGPVPVLLVNAPDEQAQLRDGSLADLAPTLLAIMGLKPPAQMTGRSLLAPPDQAMRHHG
ncbi:MAG: phosphoglycerate mutase (2,3-diphosphoglycerate-independent) [Rhodospirillaceae bacterium]|nr:phosphoglycerate mutase (2,3-diphosphoglycerate-independent) [Rhodospirillaceae bacterium]